MGNIKDDDVVLLVCNSMDAIPLVENDAKILGSLVMTDVVDIGTIYVVKKEEFLDWLNEKGVEEKIFEEEETEEEK